MVNSPYFWLETDKFPVIWLGIFCILLNSHMSTPRALPALWHSFFSLQWCTMRSIVFQLSYISDINFISFLFKMFYHMLQRSLGIPSLSTFVLVLFTISSYSISFCYSVISGFLIGFIPHCLRRLHSCCRQGEVTPGGKLRNHCSCHAAPQCSR